MLWAHRLQGEAEGGQQVLVLADAHPAVHRFHKHLARGHLRPKHFVDELLGRGVGGVDLSRGVGAGSAGK